MQELPIPVVDSNGNIMHFSSSIKEDDDPRMLPECFKIFQQTSGFNLNVDKLVEIY
jgi:hypothetical protein